MKPLMRRPPALYWAGVLLLAAFLLALGVQFADIQDAQQQARQAIAAKERSQALAKRCQGQIEALQRTNRHLQDTLAAEQERFERYLAELGEYNAEE